MDSKQWEWLQQHFEVATGLSAEEQQAYVEPLRLTHPLLAEELAGMLAADGQADSWLDRPAFPTEEVFQTLSQREGERIGPYQLKRLIGKGGMGNVYLGKRVDGGFEQEVAIKLLRPGFDQAYLLDRFRTERQIQARLEHPNIARLLDGGRDQHGHPYFSMEYVPGMPIDGYCEAHQLPIPERLTLFLQVCDALSYAHRQLVIHRDLKPSNILISDAGTVKLLDFGIARLLEEESTLTQVGDRLYTPEYASPEQVRGKTVGTATDVYSLGVVLYELLCGKRPLELQGLSPGEREQQLLSQQPSPPSERVAAHSSAQSHLSGDLDTICLKALRKEPERRYESVQALAQDVQRHLNHQPVLARPDTWAYRAGKYLRRNRLGLAVAAGVGLLLISLVSFYTWRLGKERDQARNEAEKSQAVTEFLADIFESNTPYEAGADTLLARDLLDRGAERIPKEFQQQPEIQIELLGLLGELYTELGLWEVGKTQYLAALETQAEQLPEQGQERVHLLIRLANLYIKNGFLPEADSIAQEASMVFRQLPNPQPTQAGELYQIVGDLFLRRRQLDSAEHSLFASLEAYQQAYQPPHITIAVTLKSLGSLYVTAHEGEKAIAYYEKSLAMFRELQATENLSFREAAMLHNLGMAHQRSGNLALADSLVSAGIDLFFQQYDTIHPVLANMFRTKSSLYLSQGQLPEAEAAIRKSQQIYLNLYGPDHSLVAKSISDLASIKADLSEWEEAEQLYLQALDIQQKSQDPSAISSVYVNLARLKKDQGQLPEAEAYFLQALETDKAFYQGPHLYVVDDLNGLGNLAEIQAQPERALSYYQAAMDLLRSGLGDQNRFAAQTYVKYGHLLALQQDRTGSSWLKQGLEIQETLFATGDHRILRSQRWLGEAWLEMGEVEKADSLLQICFQTLEEKKGREHPETQELRELLEAIASDQ
ncbi:MAG: serine/threonine-protein kinase [Bacteroidota bacterium]